MCVFEGDRAVLQGRANRGVSCRRTGHSISIEIVSCCSNNADLDEPRRDGGEAESGNRGDNLCNECPNRDSLCTGMHQVAGRRNRREGGRGDRPSAESCPNRLRAMESIRILWPILTCESNPATTSRECLQRLLDLGPFGPSPPPPPPPLPVHRHSNTPSG